MERSRGIEMEEKIFVAVGKKVRESKQTLLWALRISGGHRKICILHVHKPTKGIPMMGGKFTANRLIEQEVKGYREVERKKMQKSLNKYLLICALQGVRAETRYIEMDNIEKGIIELVSQLGIRKLVMGAAADKHYSKRKKVLKSKKAIFVYQQAHICCKIWFVCCGQLIHTRECSVEGTDGGIGSPLPWQSDNLSFRALSLNSLDGIAGAFSQKEVGGLPIMQGESVAEDNADEEEGVSRGPTQSSRHLTLSSSELVGISDEISIIGEEGCKNGTVLPSMRESQEDFHYSSPKEPHEGINELFNQLEQAMVEAENSKREAFEEFVRRQQVEKKAIEAIRKAKALESSNSTGTKQRKEMEKALEREMIEIQKLKNQWDEVRRDLRIAQEKKSVVESRVAESVQMVKELEEKVISVMQFLIPLKRERDELQIELENAVKEAEKQGNRREEDIASSLRRDLFTEFSFLDIKEATQNFDPSLKIGGGGYGSVYQGSLRHTKVAIKVLKSQSLQGHQEFQLEVDVLSRVRHPNLITLIGSCPESWSLVYEFLPNGSLEDRFACKGNTVPLSWQTRIRIASEVCSALVFLHSNKPHSIIHGDFKPANILLDSNFVSKLGDFGLCRLILRNENSSNTSSLCCLSDLKGTLPYMDPEFLATGELTPKSDVYSFGITLLQLLTGKPPFGIVKEVKCALERGNLNALLDKSAGEWPFVQAKQLVHLGLRCCEMNRRSRPSLGSEVCRVLEGMRASCGASSSFHMNSDKRFWIPSNFICPIFQQVMKDPHIASDGFTYEAEAIKGWLDSGNKTSPITNFKLDHYDLLPNLALRSVIQDWLQQP